jgi:dihydroneopterin aldolase
MAILRMAKMKFYGHHGVTEEEREKGGNYEVDCEIETDISLCANSDNLEDAIDYGALYHIIHEHMENYRYDLVETLAEKLKDEMKKIIGTRKFTLRIRKMEPPIAGAMAYFEVETSE